MLLGAVAGILASCYPSPDDESSPPSTVVVVEKPELNLPKEAEDWDYIGTYRLQSGGQEWVTKLYVRDTDSICEKQMAREGWGNTMYPNSFTIHSFFQTGSEEWKHQEIYGAARVRLVRVGEITPKKVELILRPNFMIWLGQDGEVPPQQKNINAPFSKYLSFERGLPVVKDKNGVPVVK
jgi:hypothetical protein